MSTTSNKESKELEERFKTVQEVMANIKKDCILQMEYEPSQTKRTKIYESLERRIKPWAYEYEELRLAINAGGSDE